MLILHGGPGSGSTPGGRRSWDPDRYRIVQMDQRNCGHSTPSASDRATDLSTNTTRHLLGDIELLREHLGVHRWVVWGGSWGVTLALVYAQTHPDRVRALILVSVTMTRRSDVHWLYHEVGRYLPAQWHRFRAGVPVDQRDGDLVAAYYRLLNQPSGDATRQQAAQDWCDWEDAVLSLEPGWTPNTRYNDPAFRMRFARIVTHYFHHHAWLEDEQILRDAPRLAGIPGVLIHGQLDLGGPVDVAWLLHRAWPDSELHIVASAGHQGGDETRSHMIAAAHRFAAAP